MLFCVMLMFEHEKGLQSYKVKKSTPKSYSLCQQELFLNSFFWEVHVAINIKHEKLVDPKSTIKTL